MARCFIWKQDVPAAVEAGKAERQAMNYGVIDFVIAVQLHSSTMSLLTRSAPIVASSSIAQQAAVADRVAVQAAAVALHHHRSCSSSMPIAPRHRPVRDG